MATIHIKGTALRPGLVPPKIGKNWDDVSGHFPTRANKQEDATYNKDNEEKEEDVGNVLELKPQVLWDEGQWGVFGCPDLVTRKLVKRIAILVEEVRWQRQIEVQLSRTMFQVDLFFLLVVRVARLLVTIFVICLRRL